MIKTKQVAVDNLFDFADILESLGIVFWLDGGTLLGAYRDKDFCEDDEDDIDVFTWSNYSIFTDKIKQLAEEKGFTLSNHWKGDEKLPGRGQEMAFTRETSKVDINFYEKKGSDAWSLVYYGDRKRMPTVTPAKYYEELQLYEFYGRKFNIPRDIEGYLAYRYGDWQTKISRSNYSCFNKEQLKALIPEYKFYEEENHS